MNPWTTLSQVRGFVVGVGSGKSNTLATRFHSIELLRPFALPRVKSPYYSTFKRPNLNLRRQVIDMLMTIYDHFLLL